MSKNSPWGPVQNEEIINNSVASVSTAGHGGIRVAFDYAIGSLSEEAREVSIRLGDFFYFEEDCNWAIVPWELRTLLFKFFPDSPLPGEALLEDLKTNIIRWNTEYALKTGLIGPGDPLPTDYTCKGRGPHYNVHSLKRSKLTGETVCTCGHVLLQDQTIAREDLANLFAE